MPRSKTAVYLCVCGYRPDKPWRMTEHYKKCPEWKNRKDPRGLSIWREAQQRAQREQVKLAGGSSE